MHFASSIPFQHLYMVDRRLNKVYLISEVTKFRDHFVNGPGTQFFIHGKLVHDGCVESGLLRPHSTFKFQISDSDMHTLCYLWWSPFRSWYPAHVRGLPAQHR